MKQKILLVIIMEMAVLLGGSFWYLFVNRESIQVGMDDFYLERFHESGGYSQEAGFYVDGSYEGALRYIKLPAINLGSGTYEVKVEYERGGTSDADKCFSEVKAVPDSAYRVVSGKISLPAEYHEISYRFHIKPGSGDVVIQNGLADGADDYLLIRNVSVSYLPLASATRFLGGIILIFLLLDGGIFLFLYENRIFKTKEDKIVLNALVITFLVASYPLFTDFMQYGDDIAFHLMRIEGLKGGILSGAIPVRIQPVWLDNNGYAVSVMYGDLLLYIPAFFRILGASVQFSYKLFVALVNISTVLVSYYCFSKIGKNKYVGLTGCILYSLSLYRLSNIYIRSAVGEYLSMIFFPLVVYGLWKVYVEDANCEKYKNNWGTLVIAFTGIIESHVLSVEMTGLFTVITCLLLWKKTFQRNTFIVLSKAVVVTVLVNLGFLIPLFDYFFCGNLAIPYSGAAHLQGEGINLAQLFLSSFRMVSGGNIDGNWVNGRLALTIGLPFTIMLVIFFIERGRLGKEYFTKETKVCLGLAGLAMLMATKIFPYEFLCDGRAILDRIGSIQFPWRFLGIASVLLSWAVCILLRNSHDKWNGYEYKIVLVGMCLLAGMQSLNMLSKMLNEQPAYRVYDTAEIDSFSIGGGEYLPVKTNRMLLDRNLVASEKLDIEDFVQKYNEIDMKIKNNSSNPENIELPLLFYKGYKAQDKAKGQMLKLVCGENNRITVSIPGGFEGVIEVRFSEPWYWRLGEFVTVISLIFIITIYLKRNKNNKLLRTV